MSFTFRPIGFSESAFAQLLADAESDGSAFVRRLGDHWLAGIERFDRPGEVLLGAFSDGALVAIGGITLDPYAPEAGLARLRHLYVLRSWRSRGIGRELVVQLLKHARGRFDRLRLSTDSAQAARFYERLGFLGQAAPKQSHFIRL